MTDLARATATRAAPTGEAATARLRARFRGALLRPGEEGYEEARRVWNGAIDRRPALVARCAGADDVVEAVRFARDNDLPVSVRGGGHAVAGHAVVDGGLMIDLSLMKAVRVDREAGMARAAGGVLLGELDRAPSGSGWPSHPGSSATPASAG
jgi:FAD/FMN-containing dehydrogenase